MFKYYAFIAFLSLSNMAIAMDTPPAPRCKFTEIEALINGPDSPDKRRFVQGFFKDHGKDVHKNEVSYGQLKNYYIKHTTPQSSPQSSRSSDLPMAIKVSNKKTDD